MPAAKPERSPLTAPSEERQKSQGMVKASILSPFRDASGTDLFLLSLGVLCAALAGVFLPYFFSSMGDTLNELNTTMQIRRSVVQLIIAGVCCLVLHAVSCFSMEVVADRLTARMRCKYVSSVLGQSMEWYDAHDSASLPTRLDVRLEDVRDGIGMKLVAVCANLTMIAGSLVIAFITCWSITLYSLAGFAPVACFGTLLGRSMRKMSLNVNRALEAAGGVATETFSNMRTVAAFGGERHAVERYDMFISKAEKAGIVGGVGSGVCVGGLLSTIFGMYALAFYLSGHKAADSMEELLAQLPPGGESVFQGPPSEWPKPQFRGGSAFVISISLLIASFMISNISGNLAIFFKAVESAADIYRVIDEPSKINPTSDEGEKDVPLDGDLVFDSVTFSYPSRPDFVVFKNFSLRIRAGKSVAFVGPSGCGKSTLLQLVQRIYDPSQGTVSIAGKDVKSLNTRWYRSCLGVVMQEPRLFSVSIEDNIRMGSPATKTFAEIEEVAKQAHVASFVEQLPLKYKTMCGYGGAQLSGGQKQRVALARALLRKPAVLILDEATSALDSKSEKKVQEALDEVIRTSKSTTLIVAHRLTTIQGVDEIIVLDNRGNGAEVVQRGTHEELLQNTQGLYYHLFNSQSVDRSEKEGAQQQLSVSADVATNAGLTTNGEIAATNAAEDDDDLVLPDPSEGTASVADLMDAAVGLKTPALLAGLSRKAITASEKNSAGLTRPLKLLAPHWFSFLVMVLASAISGACYPLQGWLLSCFTSELFQPDVQKMRRDTDFWALMMLIYVLARFPVEFLKQCLKEYLASRLSKKLRLAAFENLVHQDMSFFDSPSNSTGTLASILSGDISVVTTAATGNFVSAFHALSCVVVGVSIGFWNSWRLALVLLATFLLSAAAMSVDHRLSRPQFNAAGGSSKKKGGDSASGIFAEAIQGIRVVMSFGLEDHFSKLYEKAATQDLARKARAAIGFGISWGLSQSTKFFVYSLAFWYGGKLSADGKNTPSEVMSTVFPVIFASSGLGAAIVYSTDATKARRALADVFRVIDKRSLIDIRDAGSRGAMLEDFSGAVDYQHVSFRYPTRLDQRVYKDLSFSISPGESVALVGASGCGKSTAVQLLLRFYDLQNSKEIPVDGKSKADDQKQGAILADSINIQNINLTQFRSFTGLVSQEPVLFNLSIAENIRYSKPDATQAEVEEAARMANAHGFISGLPEGYNTSAGSAGAQLSGGQRQRIAIARALLRNPKVLILDEATSALDSESEKLVQATLDRVVGGSEKRSTIMIAHRLSTIKSADKIVVLQNNGEGSEVVEVGTHAQLMSISDGVYRSLVLSAKEHE